MSMTRNGAAICRAESELWFRFRKFILPVTLVLGLAAFVAPVLGQSWSFALIGDPRSGARDYTAALKYLRDARIPAGQWQGLPEFVVVAGDFDPVDTNYALFRGIFSGTPGPRFMPVIGNHDASYRKFICDTIMPKEGIRDPFGKSTVSYYVDVHNVRLIVVDQYQGTGFKDGCVNDAGIRWIEQAIASGAHADHIFITLHEPAFCRVRHVGDGFDACPDERNRFWDMIVQHGDKVRAVFAGHTHNYSVMRVRDPRGPASDGKSYPFESEGIYQFDAGAAGNSDDGMITVITFVIDGRAAMAQVVQSKNGRAKFSVTRSIDLMAK